MAARILIVDDDPAECGRLEEIIRGMGHLTESAGGGEAALARLRRNGVPPISAVILDLVMPDLDGMTVLERIGRESFGVPVIVQTAARGADAAGSAMRLGAMDFLVKPGSAERIKASLANALRLGALQDEIVRMRRGRSGMLTLGDIVVETPATERVLRLAERAARTSTPVLIEGERGVGKEFLARALHGSSGRRGRAFMVLRCEHLGEAELQAALSCPSAAEGGRGGKAADSRGGTLYLDEIGTLSPTLQERLAAILETQERSGSSMTRRSRNDIRIIAAASRPLIELVSAGRFRDDLFYRLSVTPIWLPPLRERRGEIPLLARRTLARLAAEEGRGGALVIATAAMELLASRNWPGNFRELENAIFRAIMLCEGGELLPMHFPQPGDRMDAGLQHGGALPMRRGGCVADQEHAKGEASLPAASLADTQSSARYGLARLLDERGELRRFEALEEEVIRFAIGHHGGRMSEVARRLGIGRSTLYRKMRDYGIASEEALAS